MSNQIDPWSAEFGDAYHARQIAVQDEAIKREQLWHQALYMLPRVSMDILEIGAGMGPNLRAIDRLLQSTKIKPNLYAVEPNDFARAYLLGRFNTIFGAADAIKAKDNSFDLVFTYGVLIHLPDPLAAMREMHRVSRRFIMCAEYFAPDREAVPYRDGVPLFRDDYGALWMDNFDLNLLGYGFCWKRTTELDNVTWFLMEKR